MSAENRHHANKVSPRMLMRFIHTFIGVWHRYLWGSAPPVRKLRWLRCVLYPTQRHLLLALGNT